MRTFIHFLVLIVGGLIVLSGCASAPVENTPEPTAVPRKTTSDATTNQADSSASTGFVFYDSYADW